MFVKLRTKLDRISFVVCSAVQLAPDLTDGLTEVQRTFGAAYRLLRRHVSRAAGAIASNPARSSRICRSSSTTKTSRWRCSRCTRWRPARTFASSPAMRRSARWSATIARSAWNASRQPTDRLPLIYC